jgi:tyrosinase
VPAAAPTGGMMKAMAGTETMDIRRSAVDLSAQERDRFLEALIRLKHHPAPGGPAGISVYDQFVALHGAVFAVVAPGLPPGDTVNFGHWNIGFCAWHRQYLRELEKALQAEVAGVTLPYWDWTDHVGALTRLFTAEFLGSLRVGAPGPVTDGVLRNPVPVQERPGWWPSGADGYPIHPLLDDGFGSTLARGSVGVGWPPTRSSIQQLEQLVIQQPDAHPFWYFWLVLEQGHPQISSRTHNTGHNFVGGHMSGGFSPNDPVFWLHHANVDRLWANWQSRRLGAVPGSTPTDHYPPPGQLSPLDGDPAPPGHRLDDAMWPWVGNAPGYDVDLDPAVKALLPDFTNTPVVTVKDVLSTETIDAQGYRYAAPDE